ncbi:MAG: three-Cys-motif partner protein TcmP [Candidatus Poribacteria bacterium]|nr:three-Cys-motif partner protein TcmP [Candidatus Poribacteria bacterium]
MNNIGQTFGGDWTEQKLECVSKYLDAYTKIMRLRKYKYTYIDAFAGMGYRELKNHDDPAIQSFLAGSARRALEVKRPFPNYVFIEADKRSFAELKKLKDEFPDRNIKCINKEANESVRNRCQETNWKENRALVFLDPYGMEVDWTTIELIARTQAIDLWLLFPIGMGVNRLLKNDGNILKPHRKKLDQLFGRTDWFEEFYQLSPQLSLFSENVGFVKKDNIFSIIEQYYLKRLASIFEFVAQNPFHLRNSKNSLMYLLCFAAGNPNASIALKIAEDILEKMRTPSQLTLPFME